MRYVLRKLYYLFNVIRIILTKHNVKVCLSSEIKYPSLLNHPAKIGGHSFLSGSLGRYSYIGRNCSLNANIGSFCSIADNVRTVAGDHPLTHISTSPVFYSTQGQAVEFFADKEEIDELKLFHTNPPVACIIENDVWIGENVLIRGGVRIGTGACIAMGAVVTKDVSPYSVVGGVPARVIKKRFDNETIQLLLNSEWWNNDTEWLKNNYNSFVSIEDFKKILL